MSTLLRSGATISTPLSIAYSRTGDGGAVEVTGDAELRKELIERVNRGEHIELLTAAVVYAQGGDYRNRDRRRFAFEALDGYARTAKGTPLLLDHWRSMDEHVGHCETSEATAEGDVLRVQESLICNAPRSVLPVLRGPVCFSMGWSCDWTTVICSYCQSTVLDCGHAFWGYVREKSGRVPVYWTFTGPETMADERSLVPVPQAAGTGTEDWEKMTAAFSAEFAACRSRLRSIHYRKGDDIMSLKRLAEKLGLDANDDDSVVLHVKTVSARAEELAGKVSALTAEIETLKKDKATLTATIAGHEKTAREAECARVVRELVEAGHIAKDGPLARLIEECYTAGNVEQAMSLAEGFRQEATARNGDGSTASNDDSDGRGDQGVEVKPELEVRQTPSGAVLDGGKPAQGSGAPVQPDYSAAFDRLPEHVRVMAGSKWAQNPRRYFELNPARAAEVGITF